MERGGERRRRKEEGRREEEGRRGGVGRGGEKMEMAMAMWCLEAGRAYLDWPDAFVSSSWHSIFPDSWERQKNDRRERDRKREGWETHRKEE